MSAAGLLGPNLVLPNKVRQNDKKRHITHHTFGPSTSDNLMRDLIYFLEIYSNHTSLDLGLKDVLMYSTT